MAGVGIFGVWPAFIFSSIGQIIGSIIAFALGRFFGVKLVTWIVGEETLHKYQDMIKGRDKLMLTVMFLFPVFPDDVLCLVAGLSSMTWPYFIIVMCICRPITCLGNAGVGLHNNAAVHAVCVVKRLESVTGELSVTASVSDENRHISRPHKRVLALKIVRSGQQCQGGVSENYGNKYYCYNLQS